MTELRQQLESAQLYRVVNQRELIDLCSRILEICSLLGMQLDLPKELFDIRLRSVFNLCYLQNDIKQRYRSNLKVRDI